jgi:hypothetical protein
MTNNEIKCISELAFIAAFIITWRLSKMLYKRLGCKNDWEMLALIGRKIKLLSKTWLHH